MKAKTSGSSQTAETIEVSAHARKRWFERHGRASGWNALSSVEDLAAAAWNGGTLKWLAADLRVVKDFGGCRFIFSPDGQQPRALITFYEVKTP